MALSWFKRSLVALTMLLCGHAAVMPAGAAVRETILPLGDGQILVRRLMDTIGRDLGVPPVGVPFAKVDLSGDKATLFCRQLTDALAPGCRAAVEQNAIRLYIDTASLPKDAWSMQRTARLLLTGKATSDATCDRYGLRIPDAYDPSKPLVVLIHGLDSSNAMWGSMVNLLQAEGHQVGSFAYPDDGAIAEAGLLLADGFADLRLKHPNAKPVRIVAHSMGGLVARHYIEGAGYRGGVDRLIMLGTPNHGSNWTAWRWATEWNSQYKICKTEGNWTWSRLTEDGNGEAATDLKPGSSFLTALNALPRRQGVGYSIIAGDRSAVRQVGADWVACTADYVPKQWWGFRQAHQGLINKAEGLRATASDCDGPVTLDSAKLDGVDDFVVVNADHTSLACGNPPAAWPAIKERLAK